MFVCYIFLHICCIQIHLRCLPCSLYSLQEEVNVPTVWSHSLQQGCNQYARRRRCTTHHQEQTLTTSSRCAPHYAQPRVPSYRPILLLSSTSITRGLKGLRLLRFRPLAQENQTRNRNTQWLQESICIRSQSVLVGLYLLNDDFISPATQALAIEIIVH